MPEPNHATPNGVDKVSDNIEIFNSETDSNECQFSITHHGKDGHNGFFTEWETEDGDVNNNDEVLDGWGHQVDTTHEQLSSAGHLRKIRFNPYGDPCVKSITISCGAKAIAGTGYIQIKHQHMNEAWNRKGNSRHVLTEENNSCVRFNKDGYNYGYKAMDIDAGIFKCANNDGRCIQSHLEMF